MAQVGCLDEGHNLEMKKKPQDNFEDWIDNVNGFMHFLNPHPTSLNRFTTMAPNATYITDTP